VFAVCKTYVYKTVFDIINTNVSYVKRNKNTMSENPPVQPAPLPDDEMTQMATDAARNMLQDAPLPPPVDATPAPGKARAAWENATGAATDAMAWLNAKVTTPVGEGASLMEKGAQAKRWLRIGGQVAKFAGVALTTYALVKGHGTGCMEMLTHQTGSGAGHMDTPDITVDHESAPAPEMDLAAHTTSLPEHHFTEEQSTIDNGEGWFKKLDEMGITDRKEQEAFLHEHGDELKDRGLAYFDEHQHQWGMNLVHPDGHDNGHLSQGDMELIDSLGKKDGFIPHDTAAIPDATTSGAPHTELPGGDNADHGIRIPKVDQPMPEGTQFDSADHANHDFSSGQQTHENSTFDSTDHADHDFIRDQQAQDPTFENSTIDSTDHADHTYPQSEPSEVPTTASAPTPVETPLNTPTANSIPQVSDDSGPSRALELTAAGVLAVPAFAVTYQVGKDMIQTGDPLAVAAQRKVLQGAGAAGRAYRATRETIAEAPDAAARAYQKGKERFTGSDPNAPAIQTARILEDRWNTADADTKYQIRDELDNVTLGDAKELLAAFKARGSTDLHDELTRAIEHKQNTIESWTRLLQSGDSAKQARVILEMRNERDIQGPNKLNNLLNFADSMGYTIVSDEIRRVAAEPVPVPASS
jgi:hypothetical protein